MEFSGSDEMNQKTIDDMSLDDLEQALRDLEVEIGKTMMTGSETERQLLESLKSTLVKRIDTITGMEG